MTKETFAARWNGANAGLVQWARCDEALSGWEAEIVNTKARRNQGERRIIAVLEAAGYRYCRSSGSLGEWDVIGVGCTHIVLVQIKSNDWPGSVSIEILREFRAPPGVRKLSRRWRGRHRLPHARTL